MMEHIFWAWRASGPSKCACNSIPLASLQAIHISLYLAQITRRTLQVQARIGASKAIAFDLTAACSGFVVGLVTAAQFIRTGRYRHILIIGADALSRYVDWRDRGKSSPEWILAGSILFAT